MSEIQNQIKKWPVTAIKKIKSKTIHAYQGMIRFMLDEEGLNGKEILDTIAGEYLEDFVNYREQDFGMTNEEFIAIIKRIG